MFFSKINVSLSFTSRSQVEEQAKRIATISNNATTFQQHQKRDCLCIPYVDDPCISHEQCAECCGSIDWKCGVPAYPYCHYAGNDPINNFQ